MQEEIKRAIDGALESLGIPQADFVVEHPAELVHGDYASNVALAVARELRQAPRDVAAQLLAVLDGTIETVEKIEIAGPGFLNFYLTRDWFAQQILEINEAGEEWGKNESLVNKKILIEKSAPNLYKPFHVGHLLNVSIAESVSRLMKFSDAEVVDVSYPSDISLGVAKAVWSIQKNGGDTSDIRALGDAYVKGTKAYEESEEAQCEIKAINTLLNTEQSGLVWELYQAGRKTSLEYFLTITKRLGSAFDDHFYESEAGVVGKEIVKTKVGEVFEESNGAIIFAGEKYGLHTRVFITSSDLPVYEAKDIGLVKMKFERHQPDESILYTDIEQKQYFEVIKKAAELTFGEWGEKTKYLQHGRLRFADGKVSSRLGNVPLAEDLIEEVKARARSRIVDSKREYGDADLEDLTEKIAIGALKYSFLKVAPGQNITFDFSQALSFEGDSGPYLQYTYARIQSVLKKAAAAGVKPAEAAAHTPATPYHLEQVIYRFPEVIEEALLERAPHKVVTFLTELAGTFNTFYAQEKIADPDDEFAPYKAALTQAVGQTLENGLWVLGIEAPQRM